MDTVSGTRSGKTPQALRRHQTHPIRLPYPNTPGRFALPVNLPPIHL